VGIWSRRARTIIMRYTCLKTIVTKVFDGVLDEPKDVLNLLQLLKEKEITCAMQVKNGPLYECVRILGMDKDRIKWRLLKDNTSLIKSSEISDIMAVRVTTNDDLMIKLKPDPSRWSTLDASSI